MLDIATEFDYQEISPPNLVKDEAMFGSGQLPKFAEDAFALIMAIGLYQRLRFLWSIAL